MSHSSVIRQYVYETDNWRRLITFFIQENVSFKIRLSEIVDVIPDNEDLATVEKFQEDFLSQDRIVAFLSYELQEQKKLLEKDVCETGELFEDIIKHQQELRKEIKKTEEIFSKMKEEFGEYLAGKFNCFILF